ncbi:hypothetical protein NVR12_08560, partial [Staphylococcus pseudintermedius]
MDVRNIQNPSFLKSLSVKELEALSHDVRQFLIQTCAVTGGHM